jgi:hypothetical protein
MRRLKYISVSSAVALLTACAFVASASAASEGIPKLDHVFIIVLENENASATWGTPGTYLNGLLAKGTYASQYYGSSHVSADNYMAITSGQTPTPLYNADCLDWSKCETWEAERPDGGVSVANQLDAAGKTWKAYMDGMATNCQHPAADPPLTSGQVGAVYTADPYQAGYATRHDPFVYYPPIVNDQAYCDSHVVPYTQLSADLASEATTPNYVFITPDTCHDGHDAVCTGIDQGQVGGLTGANNWMSTAVPAILNSPAFTTPGVASVLFITTDEAANTDPTGCTTGPVVNGATPGSCASGVPGVGVNGGGLVGLLAIGSAAASVPAGATTAVPYDHASLLRTVEDGLGLGPLSAGSNQVIFQDSAGHLNNAGSPLEHAMSSLFS